ncbi:MAG: diaminopimelate epimerase [Acidimicrobiales bacterium]|jgi:diaminopimelate epimerase
MPDTRPLHLTKHHGAGNDFLVLVDLEGRAPLDGRLARALCDRRFGIGADGVIRILEGTEGSDLGMDLRNADGSVAEMTGNGMRCLAQAAVEAGLVKPPTFSVRTLAGVKLVEYCPGPVEGSATASVDMGSAALGADRQVLGHRGRQVDVGNPHLVLLWPDPADADIARIGAQLQADHAGGINVEFMAPGPEPEAITLRVWERGVGETQACGTGSVAAAAAAQSWDLVEADVAVHNPGGTLRVSPADGGFRLSGPVSKVADVELDPRQLLAAQR